MYPDELEIIYRDDHLIAINKPAGLLVHRSHLDYHEPHNALDILKAQTGLSLYTIHRLDKPTSGVLMFAIDKDSAANLAKQFSEQAVQKNYLAIVRGHTEQSNTIEHAVQDKDARHKGKQQATTHYKPLAKIELPYSVDRYPSARYSVVQVTPRTGRRHQIRLHMKHISHPIIGDSSYGKTKHNHFFAQHYQSERLLLHAQDLSFIHPVEGTECKIEALQHDASLRRVLSDNNWCRTDNAVNATFVFDNDALSAQTSLIPQTSLKA